MQTYATLPFIVWQEKIIESLEEFQTLNLKRVNDLILEHYSTRLGSQIKALQESIRLAKDEREVEIILEFFLNEIDDAFLQVFFDGEERIRDIPELEDVSRSGNSNRNLSNLDLGKLHQRYLYLIKEKLVSFFT